MCRSAAKTAVSSITSRAAGDAAQAEMVERLKAQGVRPTEQINRRCFRSVYFREPVGVLFEIATDDPGFTVDEPKETPGDAIKLPPWYGSRRAEIVHPCRRFADRRRGKASLRAAMEPQNSFLRAGRGVYSFSARTRAKQLCLRTGMRRKRSIHSGGLSPRLMSLTSPLTILPTQ